MTAKRYKSVGANLECPNGKEYMLVKRDDGFNVCQVCSKYTAKEIVDELNNLADENEQLKQSYKEFEDECQSTFNAMSRKQNDLYRKNFKLKEENEQLKQQIDEMITVFENSGLDYHISDELNEILNR